MAADERSVRAIRPQMVPHQSSIGSSVLRKLPMICCRRESIPAKCVISASLARSDGWNAWSITGRISQRDAWLIDSPKRQV